MVLSFLLIYTTYTMGYTLIIDNYDSFTWNVYADIAVLGGNPLVRRNDKITIEEIQVRAPFNIE
jgi:anthranilate synthase/indole-3-glycerol phosphate synthase/phosphoribosylanthranilate isomerase